MAKFGWSYPPGCTGTPYDDESAPSELVESILSLLETAKVPTKTCDQICSIIERWERSASEPKSDPAAAPTP